MIYYCPHCDCRVRPEMKDCVGCGESLVGVNLKERMENPETLSVVRELSFGEAIFGLAIGVAVFFVLGFLGYWTVGWIGMGIGILLWWMAIRHTNLWPWSWDPVRGPESAAVGFAGRFTGAEYEAEDLKADVVEDYPDDMVALDDGETRWLVEGTVIDDGGRRRQIRVYLDIVDEGKLWRAGNVYISDNDGGSGEDLMQIYFHK